MKLTCWKERSEPRNEDAPREQIREETVGVKKKVYCMQREFTRRTHFDATSLPIKFLTRPLAFPQFLLFLLFMLSLSTFFFATDIWIIFRIYHSHNFNMFSALKILCIGLWFSRATKDHLHLTKMCRGQINKWTCSILL